MEQKRGSFGSNFGFLMAAVGSAVGLGNIWGFPYKMGKSGGFAFLLIYLVLAVFIGLSVMVGEMALGRKTGMGVIGAYKKMAAKWAWLGYAGVVVPFCILCFYNVLGGMVLRYAVGYLICIFGGDGFAGQASDAFFGYFICNGMSMVIYTALFVVINVIIVSGGISGGVEKFNSVGMPALFVLLVIVIVYVACQPGAGAGYAFMFAANFEPLATDFIGVLKTAAGQMFFSLSLGMGAMVTYGSYLDKKEDLQKNSVIVVIMDTMVAILAGCVVLPACAAFGLDFRGGPGLLFSSMQVVFDKMGGFIGNLMGFLFYTLVLLAAISSSISLLEVCTASVVDKNLAAGKGGKDGGRKVACVVFALVIMIVCLPVALDGLGSGVDGGAVMNAPCQMLGIEAKGWNDCWLDFFDMISEGVIMPIAALAMCLLYGWAWKPQMMFDEVAESGKDAWGKGFYAACYKFIAPIGLVFVLYGQLKDFFF